MMEKELHQQLLVLEILKVNGFMFTIHIVMVKQLQLLMKKDKQLLVN